MKLWKNPIPKELELTDHEADWGKAEPARGVPDLFWPEREEAEHDHNQTDAASQDPVVPKRCRIVIKELRKYFGGS